MECESRDWECGHEGELVREGIMTSEKYAKPEEGDFIKVGSIRVLKYPLRDNEGKEITGLNYCEQIELLKRLSEKWKMKLRHLTLKENFMMSRSDNEYRANVLAKYWTFTGEIFDKSRDDFNKIYLKENSDNQWGIVYDSKGKSAVWCSWYSDERGLYSDGFGPLDRYVGGVLGICAEAYADDIPLIEMYSNEELLEELKRRMK